MLRSIGKQSGESVGILGDRSFAVAGPRVWNSLPATIRLITCYAQFRQHLKTHLFRT